MSKNLKQFGFSLVEIIVALAVFSVLVAGIALTVGNSTSGFQGSEDQALKERFATEAMEAIIAIRDRSWGSIADVNTSTSGITSYDVRKNSSNQWEFFVGTTTRGSLTRNVFVYDVDRDSSGNIVTSGTWDPNTKRIVVQVYAPNDTYELEGYVSNWKAYKVSQTDWDGIGGVEVWQSTDFQDDVYEVTTVGTTTAGQISIGQESLWYDSNWQYRKTITVDNTQVSATLTNYPMLVSIGNDSDLAANVGQADGGDILFTDSAGTKLDHEISEFNNTDGTLNAWVEVPTLSGSEDTIIYMYYGYAAASDQWNVNGTWNSEYAAVLHMDETSLSTPDTLADSTANGNDFRAYGTASTTIDRLVNRSVAFDGSSSDYATSSGAILTGTTGSVGGWFYVDDLSSCGGGYCVPFTQGGDSGLEMYTWGTSVYCYDNGTDLGAYTIANDTWFQGYCVKDGTTLRLYVNGAQRGSTGDTRTAYNGSASIGGARVATNNYWVPGHIDEVRYSDSAFSADLIATEYNNINSTSTFYSLGSQTDEAGAGGGDYFDNGYATSSAAVIEYNTSPEILNRDVLSMQLVYEVPTGCSLDVYLQGTNSSTDDTTPIWTNAPLLGPFSFSGTSRTTTTIDLNNQTDLAEKKWVRYNLSMTSCSTNTAAPIVYDISFFVD